MKKVLTLSLAIAMVLMMAVSAFAAAVPSSTPSPVPSPTPSPTPDTPTPDEPTPSNPVISTAPSLVAGYNENPDCTGEIIIYTYEGRSALDATSKAKLEAAFASLQVEDLGKLNKDLAKLADKMKISTSKLSVQQIFDISCNGCENHDKHGAFVITIKPTEIKNFMGILHYNGTEWELLEAEEQFGEITFVVDNLSPFAIITHDGTAQEPTSTGAIVGVVVACSVVVVAAAVVVVMILRKKNDITEDEEK